jgi:enterochelin esterase-like enzyme
MRRGIGAALGLILLTACAGPGTDSAPVPATGTGTAVGAAPAAKPAPPATPGKPAPDADGAATPATPADAGEGAPDIADEVGRGRRPSAAATPEVREAGSRIEEQALHSYALDEDLTYLIYLPPGYDASTRRYPTVYLFHGVAGDPTEWPSIGIPDAADRLITDGAIQPMLIVFPEADASYYVNGATTGRRWEDYLLLELVPHVDGTYRTLARPESRALGGLSMGGEGALQLAMRYPDMFGVAGGHSPSSRLLFEHVAADVYGDEAYFRARSPFWLAQRGVGADVKLWIDVGDEDPWRWNARALHAALEAWGVEHEFNLFPGLHEGDYWIAHLEDYLGFYDRALAGP